MYFCFCQCFIWKTQKANTTGGHKSHLCFPIIINWNYKMIVWFFISFSNWMTLNEKTKDGIYRRFCFFVFSFLHCELKETKLCITDHINIFLFFVYKLGKRKRKTNLPFSIFYYGFEKQKTKGRYIQHSVLSRFSFFHLAKEKTKICITHPISIFRFLFVD